MEIKKISDRMYQVDEHVVIFKKMPGRTLVLCDCMNGTTFCNEPTLCKHKELAIVTRYKERWDKQK